MNFGPFYFFLQSCITLQGALFFLKPGYSFNEHRHATTAALSKWPTALLRLSVFPQKEASSFPFQSLCRSELCKIALFV